MRRLVVISLGVQFFFVSGARGQVDSSLTSKAPAVAAAGGAGYLDVIDRAWRGNGMGIGAALAMRCLDGSLDRRATSIVRSSLPCCGTWVTSDSAWRWRQARHITPSSFELFAWRPVPTPSGSTLRTHCPLARGAGRAVR